MLLLASFASDYLKIEDYVVILFCFRGKMWNKRRMENKSKGKICNEKMCSLTLRKKSIWKITQHAQLGAQ